MVHTFMISNRILSAKVFNEIYKELEKVSGLKPRKIKEVYVTEALKDKGFTHIMLTNKRIDSKYKYNFIQITIIINPVKLLGINKLELLKEDQVEELNDRFNSEINKIHHSLPRLDYWIANRVDYAVNINTPYVKEYIKLFRRGDKPKGFKEYSRISTGRGEKGGLYLFNGSITVNFYDKENERMFNGFNTEGAKDLLRLEVQCKISKTNTTKVKYHFDSKHIWNYLSEEICRNQLQCYYDKVIGQGDYYTLSEAIKRVNDSKYTPSTKSKLIDVLKDISLHRSICNARKESQYNVNCFNRYLKQIRALGVNAVTIPARWKLDNLQNIYSNLLFR